MDDRQLLNMCLDTLGMIFSELEAEMISRGNEKENSRYKYTLSNMAFETASSAYEWIKMEKERGR